MPRTGPTTGITDLRERCKRRGKRIVELEQSCRGLSEDRDRLERVVDRLMGELYTVEGNEDREWDMVKYGD